MAWSPLASLATSTLFSLADQPKLNRWDPSYARLGLSHALSAWLGLIQKSVRHELRQAWVKLHRGCRRMAWPVAWPDPARGFASPRPPQSRRSSRPSPLRILCFPRTMHVPSVYIAPLFQSSFASTPKFASFGRAPHRRAPPKIMRRAPRIAS